jgi:2-formylbenzoate dehydrogenase
MSRDEELRDVALSWAGSAEHRMLVGGRLVPARDSRTYPVTDPAEGAQVAVVPDADPRDVDDAVTAADTARVAWARTSAVERAAAVRAMAAVAEAHRDEIAALDSLDTGVPLWMTRTDVDTGVARMRMFADWALRLTGETIPATPTHLSYTQRVPFGVVARIVAYNHPAMFGISKIAAPLVAGNTVVLKPSEQTPLSMLRLAELWAGVVPAGVLSVLTGATAAPGEQLVRDERIRRIAFTGSAATGRAIQRAAAESAVKTVSLELGGKNALIVLPDADLGQVAAGAVKGMNLAFAGQSCGSTSRIFVPRVLVEELAARLKDHLAALRPGSAFETETTMGPLISAQHHARVSRYVDAAVASSARIVTGGARPQHLPSGNFFAPTLVVDEEPGSELASSEVFGPVLTLISTDDIEQAIGWANGVRYGLTASVYGTDIGRALSVAGRMEAGYVWINDTSTHFAAVPFGGVKESGVGREESFEELVDYTQIRATSVRLG